MNLHNTLQMRKSFGMPHSAQCLGSLKSLKRIWAPRQIKMFRYTLRKQRRLIIAPFKQSGPMQWNWDHQHIWFQNIMCNRRHPDGRWSNNILSIPVFKAQHNPASVFIVQNR